MKAAIDELTSYDLRTKEFYAQKNKPVLDMNTPGWTTDIYEIEEPNKSLISISL